MQDLNQNFFFCKGRKHETENTLVGKPLQCIKKTNNSIIMMYRHWHNIETRTKTANKPLMLIQRRHRTCHWPGITSGTCSCPTYGYAAYELEPWTLERLAVPTIPPLARLSGTEYRPGSIRHHQEAAHFSAAGGPCLLGH